MKILFVSDWSYLNQLDEAEAPKLVPAQTNGKRKLENGDGEKPSKKAKKAEIKQAEDLRNKLNKGKKKAEEKDEDSEEDDDEEMDSKMDDLEDEEESGEEEGKNNLYFDPPLNRF